MDISATKKTLLNSLLLSLGVLTILALFFNLYSVSESRWDYSESGFSFLGFSSRFITGDQFLWAIPLISLTCWGCLLVGLTMIVVAIVSFVSLYDTTRLTKIFSNLCLGFISAYFLLGIIIASVWASHGDSAMTYAFIPFIFVLGLYITHRVISKSTPSPAVYTQSNAASPAPALGGMEFDLQRATAKQAGASVGAVYRVQGAVGKSLTVYNNKCVITTKTTIRSVIAGNFTDGEKTIYYADLTGVQFRKCSAVLLGYLQFENASGQRNRGGNDWVANYNSENSFTFEATINELMQEIADFIKGKVEEYKEGNHAPQAVPMQQSSSADEVLKLKQLLDMGVITQEEFDQKKKELLHL